MKKLILIILGLSIALTIGAQESKDMFNKKANFINIGYGFGNLEPSFVRIGEYSTNVKSTTGPFYLKYEHAMTSKFGFGINAAYSKFNAVYMHTDRYTQDQSQALVEDLNWTSLSVLFRFNYHFLDNKNIDPYFGGGFGYRYGNHDVTTNDPANPSRNYDDPTQFGFDATFGCRFMFSKYIGAYAEIGFAKTLMQMGITAKF